MATSRRVTATGKDEDGDITALCNSTSTWLRVSKAKAIQQIEDEDYRYYVKETGTQEVEVRVRTRYGSKYLTTDADSDSANNLDNLPDC